MRHLSIFVMALAMATTPAAADPWRLDKSHAHVLFSADHLGFSEVHGRFMDFDAEIDFDPDAVEDTEITFVVRTDSIETGWEARDRDLRGTRFFDVETYPEMRFESTRVRPVGETRAEIYGNLTIRDVTQPVVLEAELNQIGPSPLNPEITVAGFSVTGEVDRTEFGMTFGAPLIGAVIPIRIELEISPAG